MLKTLQEQLMPPACVFSIQYGSHCNMRGEKEIAVQLLNYEEPAKLSVAIGL